MNAVLRGPRPRGLALGTPHKTQSNVHSIHSPLRRFALFIAIILWHMAVRARGPWMWLVGRAVPVWPGRVPRERRGPKSESRQQLYG